MSKKQKKSGEDKKVMTEEEMVVLQQKALSQEVMDRTKEQAVIQFLKDKLQEDEKSTEVQLQKLNAGWRTLLHLCKTEKQKNQIDVLTQTYKRQLDGIDSGIKDMADELMEKERHSAEVRRCHRINISRLYELQKQRIGFLQDEWESSGVKIKECYKLQREQMSAEDKLQVLNLEDTAPAVRDTYEDLLREIVAGFNENIELYEESFQKKRKKLVQDCRGQLKEHLLVLKLKQLELEQDTSRNQRNLDALNRSSKDMENKKKELVKLKAKQTSVDTSESQVREQLVAAESQNMELRARIEHNNTRARKHLTELTLKHLKRVITQGEKVLRMATLCKKLEDRLLMTEELQKTLDREDTEEQAECKFPELTLLARLQNVAQEKHHALRQQRNALLCQNKQLWRRIEDMHHDWDKMEVRKGAQGLTQGHDLTARGSDDTPGRGSSKLISPVSGSTPGRSPPLSLFPELTVTSAPTVQSTAHPHFHNKK